MTAKMVSKISRIVSDSYDDNEIDFALDELNIILDKEKIRKIQIRNEIYNNFSEVLLKKTIVTMSNKMFVLEEYLGQVENNIEKLETFVNTLSSRKIPQSFTIGNYINQTKFF